jgi:hypothetical protein
MRLPAWAARQLPDQSTTLRVDSPFTDDSRLRGALPLPDSCTAAKQHHSITSSAYFEGEQTASLGWTARDLFGLPRIPEKPAPNYRRLSRYDETGLIWLLRGRPVVALSDTTAAIEQTTGAITIYRKNNKPALGPVGDSLDDFER